LSRGRKPSNKPKDKNHRKIVEKRYYEKNKDKIYENKTKRVKSMKVELIDILGGKCSTCGYSKCIAALEFHHERNKENNIAYIIKNKSKQKALKEIRKCVLLCSNCHREVHNKGS
jgi:predicted HNH restriction endonuclease